MKAILLSFILFSGFIGCAQTSRSENTISHKKIGGPCEGCEAIHESPVPFEQLNEIDTLQDFAMNGSRLLLTGKVLTKDLKPAKDVVLYVYHTDQSGVYPTKGDEQGWARRHGYLRSWIKTDKNGNYSFYTLKPGHYPGRNAPAHVHAIVKEPGKNEYWIDDFLFDDDPILTKEERARQQNRGGNGIIKLQSFHNLLIAKRDIILGKNVPDYH